MDFQRKLLEELMNPMMGHERTYKDPQMCTHMLALGVCPFDLFTNTKCDIGFCDKKVHDDKLVKQYQESPDRYKLGHEQQFHSFALRLINDMDRVIRRQKEKVALQETPSRNGEHEPEPSEDEKEERIAMIEGQIREYITQLQDAGERGFVDRALDLYATIELLKTNIEAIRNAVNNRKLMVCDICSATLVHNDSTQRMTDHITGKQHLGYKRLREWCKEWETHLRSERGGGGGGGDRGDRDRDRAGWGAGGGGPRRDDYRDNRDGGRGGGGRGDGRRDERGGYREDRDRRYDSRDSGRRYR